MLRTALDDARHFQRDDCIPIILRSVSKRIRDRESKRMASIGEDHMAGAMLAPDSEATSRNGAVSSEEDEDGCGIMMLDNSPNEEKHYRGSFDRLSLRTSDAEDASVASLVINGLVINGHAPGSEQNGSHV